MSEPQPQAPAPGRWLGPAVVTLLTLQLAMLWVQGAQLNRQHHDLAALQGELQLLAESLDAGAESAYPHEDPYAPSQHRGRAVRAYVRVRQDPQQPEGGSDAEQQKAAQELKAAQDSARKAVKDAKTVQSQLSISENARKAEEKAKVQEARSAWEKWALAGTVIVLGALLFRGWQRSRDS